MWGLFTFVICWVLNSYIKFIKLWSWIVHTTSSFLFFIKLWTFALMWLLTLSSPTIRNPISIESFSYIFSLLKIFNIKQFAYITRFSLFKYIIESWRTKEDVLNSFFIFFVSFSINLKDILISKFWFFLRYSFALPNFPFFTIVNFLQINLTYKWI